MNLATYRIAATMSAFREAHFYIFIKVVLECIKNVNKFAIPKVAQYLPALDTGHA